LPAIIIVALLLVAAVVVWFKVINKDSNVNVAVACPPSTVATGAAAGQALPYNALDNVTPAAPGQVQVRVLNASAQRGQAQTVSTQLLGLGFQQAASPADDPLYPKQNMTCVGQIRFGANGQAEARTLSLVLPCTQLIRDNRQDTTVDLAVGKDFIAVAPNASATSALQQLTAWANAHPAPQGGQQAQGGLQPQLSPTLLAGAHNIAC
jgi:hypothetical protein